jgi:secreted PhoX family phosphatase
VCEPAATQAEVLPVTTKEADDLDLNPSSNESLADIVKVALSRRTFLRGSLSMGALFTGGGALLAACGDDDPGTPGDPDAAPPGDPDAAVPEPDAAPPPPTRPTALGFDAVAKHLVDEVAVPAGYTATVLLRLGDPIASGVPAYTNLGTDAASSYDRRAGDHHDGMHFFGMEAGGTYDPTSATRGLLVQNHEAITPLFVHPTGQTVVAGARTVAEEVLREFYLHGVSIVEVNRGAGGGWDYAQDSAYNRRIHTLTEMELSGPLRGNAALRTKFSPSGERTRGTVNNCANGWTPWGTYLTCEENWNGYFRRVAATDNPNRSAKEVTALTRYGIAGNGRELWATVTPDTADDLYGRWNAEIKAAAAVDDYRNVANTYGWVVEIDPFATTSTPKKRTALGRFAHEGAVFAKPVAGKPVVVYSGDDSRGEYMYKFVSTATWNPADASPSNRLTAGDKYLDDGIMYVAKFNADGTGTWLALSFGSNGITATNAAYGFADQADVDLHTRLAADAAGATKMDRPEWAAVDPLTGAVYLTLTNNSASVRSLAATDAPNPRHYNDPKGGAAQYGNPNGHIIRWLEPSPEATTFTWDIYLFGAAADADAQNVNVSGLSADSDFSSPDGLWFSEATNVLWIQTDDGAFTDVTNCMLLAALPGAVGDGGAKTITSTDSTGATKDVATHVGVAPGAKLKRFLVGPVGCELTGLAENGDGTALFVNIQHPGEDTSAADIANPASRWPDRTNGAAPARPRSATLVITKNDGGKIGL